MVDSKGYGIGTRIGELINDKILAVGLKCKHLYDILSSELEGIMEDYVTALELLSKHSELIHRYKESVRQCVFRLVTTRPIIKPQIKPQTSLLTVKACFHTCISVSVGRSPSPSKFNSR